MSGLSVGLNFHALLISHLLDHLGKLHISHRRTMASGMISIAKLTIRNLDYMGKLHFSQRRTMTSGMVSIAKLTVCNLFSFT
ncbi:hypothetical protein QL285_088908 [Trifolium repens]|nr:hypothetical protein QL285_088908 [Trifolium repens]